MLQYTLFDLLVFGPIFSGIYLAAALIALLTFAVIGDGDSPMSEGNGIGAFIAGPFAAWLFIKYGLKPGTVDLSWLDWTTGAITVFGYFFVGGFWAAYKWWHKLNRWVDKQLKYAAQKAEKPNAFYHQADPVEPEYVPQPSRNKAQLFFWASYWLPSAIGSLVPNLFQHIRNGVYATFGGVYNHITDSAKKRYTARLAELKAELQRNAANGVSA